MTDLTVKKIQDCFKNIMNDVDNPPPKEWIVPSKEEMKKLEREREWVEAAQRRINWFYRNRGMRV